MKNIKNNDRKVYKNIKTIAIIIATAIGIISN